MTGAAPAAAPAAGAAAPAAAAQPAGNRGADEPRFCVQVSCRVDGEAAQVSFTTFRRTLIQQIMDSSLAFFKINPSQSQTAQLVLGGKQIISFSPTSTVEDLKLTTPDRQSLELVLMDEEPEVQFPVRDQYGNEEVLRARLYHPFVDAVRRLLDPDSPALLNPPPPVPAPPPATTQTNGSTGGSNQQTQQSHGLDVDLYRGSDVSLISLQNSPAACGLQGGEPLLLYRYGRCSREYWQSMGQPERGLKPTYAGLYISDYKNQFQGRAVFRHDLAMPLEYLLSTYCKWRGIEKAEASFLWLQFYMRLGVKDTGLSRGMDDGDTIYIFDKDDPQGRLWDGVLDGDVEAVKRALDSGASLDGPEGSFEAITSRWPLHAAAANNRLSVARVLVERGADVDRLDAVSEPALWHAVEQGHGDMVALLLELGATASDLPCPPGKTKADYAALCHAAEKGSLAMVQLLLDKGANPYTYDDTGYCAYDYLVDQAKPLELLRALLNADSAFSATQKSYQQAYQRLCAAVKRAQRYPALGCNCRTCNSVVEVRAAEAEATQTLKAQIGCVALVRAVQAGGPHCLEAMQLLYQHGALLDGQDQDGRTALHQAIRYNRLAEAKWLVQAGAHLDVPDFEGLLPLHQAACTGNVEFARLLVEAGAPINLHTVKYITQESLEAQTKKQETGNGGRKAAKKRNALDVTGLTTIGGNSALALAVRHGHAAVVEYLLSQQASFDLKNPADSSAFHAALDRGAASVASKLLQHLNKPKPGKGAAGAGAAVVAAAAPVARAKIKDTTAAKDKNTRKTQSASAESTGRGGSTGGAAAAAAAANTANSDSDTSGGGAAGGGAGDVSSPEPPLAVDAGAGLREIVQAERERLRQEKGLGRATAADATSTAGGGGGAAKAAPSLMQQLEALKAAEKAAAAKAAAEQAKEAERQRIEAEKAEAERVRAEEAAKKQAEEAAARKAAEDEERKRQAEQQKREEAERKREDEARKRQEEEQRKKTEAEEKKKAAEQAAAAAAAAKQREQEAAAAAAASKQGAQAGGKAAAGALANGGSAAAHGDTSSQAESTDTTDSAKSSGIQILFRSTNPVPLIGSKQQQQPVAAAPAAPAAHAANHGKGGRGGAAAAEHKPAAAAAAAPSTTPVSKKGKGKIKAASSTGAASADNDISTSAQTTPSRHEPHANGPKQGSTGGANKRATPGKAPATQAALAASAALSHAPPGRGHHGHHGQPLSNGPSSSGAHDTVYEDQNGTHGHGYGHGGTPGLSPRYPASNHSAAHTPVRSQKSHSRSSSFSSSNLAGLQGPWPPLQHQGPPQGPHAPAQPGAGHDGAGALLRMTTAPVGAGIGDLAASGALHMAPQHHLSPLRQGLGGPRVGGTPTAHDDIALWDDAGHLESLVMSVVTDDGSAKVAQQQHAGPRGVSAAGVASKPQDMHAAQSPFNAQQYHAAASAWDASRGQQNGAGGGGGSNTPRSVQSVGTGPAHRAAAALALDRAASADVVAAGAPASQSQGQLTDALLGAGRGIPPGFNGISAGGNRAAEEAFGSWARGGAQPGMLPGGSAAAAAAASSSWSQPQVPAGVTAGWAQWPGQSTVQPHAVSGGSTAEILGSTGQTKPAASSSADSSQAFLSTGTGGTSLSGLAATNTALLVGAAPFVPGETQWQSRAAAAAAAAGSEGSTAATPARELDPLPHLPASLFEDEGDVTSPGAAAEQPQPAQPAAASTGASTGSGNRSSGSQQPASSGWTGGSGGANSGLPPVHSNTPPPGHGLPQGHGRGNAGGGGGGGNRPASRGRPSPSVHPRSGSAGHSQDGSAGNTSGRYTPPAGNARMMQYGGVPQQGTAQPQMPGLYGAAGAPHDWYAQQAGWQGAAQGAAGYGAAMPGGAPPPPPMVPGAHAGNPHGHPAMYHMFSGMGPNAHGHGWADSTAAAAAAAAGGAMNGYWPPHVVRGAPGVGDMMGVGVRGRGVAPASGQAHRYRPH